MRKIENKIRGKRLVAFLCAIVLFAATTLVTACSEDKDCKTCTNSSGKSQEYCDDALDTLMDSQAYKDGTTTCK